MQNSDVTRLTWGGGIQSEEGRLVVKDVTPSSQLVETFTLRHRGPDTYQHAEIKLHTTLKPVPDRLEKLSTGLIEAKEVHCLQTVISRLRPRKYAENARILLKENVPGLTKALKTI